MVEIFICILMSAIFRAIEQISVFRESWSWLPQWITGRSGILNLDGYHIASALNIWSMFGAGYFFITAAMPLWLIPVLWLIHGNLFSLFYHVVFMRQGFRENFLLDWWMEIRWLLGFGVPRGYVRQKLEQSIRATFEHIANLTGKAPSERVIRRLVSIHLERAVRHFQQTGTLSNYIFSMAGEDEKS